MKPMQIDLASAQRVAKLALEIRDVLGAECDDIKVFDELLERIFHEFGRPLSKEIIPVEWHVVTTGLMAIISDMKCTAIATGEAGNIVEEQAKKKLLLEQMKFGMNSQFLSSASALNDIKWTLSNTDDVRSSDIKSLIQQIPLPNIYFDRARGDEEVVTDSLPLAMGSASLIRVIAFLDDAPLVTPQLIKADLIYPLRFRFRGLLWPGNARRLHLDLLTTLPKQEFSVSDFGIDKSSIEEGEQFEGEVAGQIKFNAAQSNLLEDLVFSLSAAFELESGDYQEVKIIGHYELRLRVTNQASHPLMSGNRRLDQHAEKLLIQLQRECPSTKDELVDLIPVLQALTLLLSTYAQEAVFKGRSNVPEAEFQASVLRDLRIRLGNDVQEHPAQAGGNTDIRFKGVIVELKVERKNGSRKHISEKYVKQATQYAGAEARQISIVLVLDLTEKISPPGDIRNDILLVDVPTHGVTDGIVEYPSKSFVFVINGNVKRPSEYSR